jgi:release factor glutamine methyltransferase
MTIQEALRAAVGPVEGASSTPRFEAEELIGRLLGLRRTELYLDASRRLSAHEAEILAGWIARRRAGEPIQYVTGRAAFRGLDLHVTPDVLVPRPETEGLVERALEVLRAERPRWPAPRVLDLGTGSGAIALAIAIESPETIVTATDVSTGALEVARGNAAALGLTGRIRLLEGHWLDALDMDERFEAVISNPPYIAESEREALPREVREHEPAVALFSGPDGLDALREIVEGAPRHLVAGGLLALEVAEARAEVVFAWLEGGRDWEGVALREDLAGRPRVVLARRQRGPAIAPAQWESAPGQW